MTKTTPERRAWLDSLKVGDEVAVMYGDRTVEIAAIANRSESCIIAGGCKFPAKTGRTHRDGWDERSGIAPVTDVARRKVEHRRVYQSVVEKLRCGTPTPVLHLLELILDWQHSPDVILAATERIHEVTRERMEAQR